MVASEEEVAELHSPELTHQLSLQVEKSSCVGLTSSWGIQRALPALPAQEPCLGERERKGLSATFTIILKLSVKLPAKCLLFNTDCCLF